MVLGGDAILTFSSVTDFNAFEGLITAQAGCKVTISLKAIYVVRPVRCHTRPALSKL